MTEEVILSGQRYASGSRTSGPEGSRISSSGDARLPSGYFVETKGMKFLDSQFEELQRLGTEACVPILKLANCGENNEYLSRKWHAIEACTSKS